MRADATAKTKDFMMHFGFGVCRLFQQWGAVKMLKNAADYCDDDPRPEPLQNELYFVTWLVFAAFWLPAVLAAVAPAAFF